MRCVRRPPPALPAARRNSSFHSTPVLTPTCPAVAMRAAQPFRMYALDPPLANEEVTLKHMPRDKPPERWKAKLGSQSEAIIKAEREPDKTPEQLRRQGYRNLKKKEFEDMTSPSGRKNPSAHKVTEANKASMLVDKSSNVMGMGRKGTKKEQSNTRSSTATPKKRSALRDNMAASPS